MASEKELFDALMKADEAGDEESARAFADEIKRLRSVAGQKQPIPANNNPNATFLANHADPNQPIVDLSKSDETDPAVIQREIDKNRNIRQYEEGPEWAKPIVAASDIANQMADSATFGWGDKAAAYLKSLTGDQSYDDALADNRKRTEAAADRSGWAGTAAKIVPAIVEGKALTDAGITASRIIPQGTGLLQRLLSAAAVGTTEGAAYGALDATGHDTDVKEGTLTGAALGGGLNVISEAALSALGGVMSKWKGTNKAPTTSETTAARKAAYDAMENSDAAYTPQAIIKMGQDLDNTVVNVPGGAREVNHASTLDKVKEVKDMAPVTPTGRLSKKAKPVPVYDMDEVRKTISRDLSDGPNSAFADRMTKVFDDTMNNPANMTSPTGKQQQAVDDLLNARDLSHRERKALELEDSVVRADRQAARNDTGDTAGNQMRQKISQILDNDVRASHYSPDELAKLDEIVKGNWLGNKARRVAKAANSEWGSYTGTIGGVALGNMFMPGSIPAAVMGGLAGKLGAKTVGDIAEGISARQTRKGIESLVDDINRGRPKVPSRKEVPISAKDRDLATRLLLLMRLQDANGEED